MLCASVFYSEFYPPPQKEFSRKNKFLITLIITAATLAFNYSLHETLYWLTGATYFWGMSLFLLVITLAVKALRGSKLSFWGCIVALFINATVFEQLCATQGVTAFIAMIYFAFKKDRKRALICGVFWLTAIVAFCVLFFAPGTAIRQGVTYLSVLSLPKRLINALAITFAHGAFTIIQFFVKPLTYVFLLFLPLIAKKFPAPKISLKPWLIIILTFMPAFLLQFLNAFGLGTAVGGRGVALSLWFMGLAWSFLWTFCYNGRLKDSQKFAAFSKKWRYPILILALLISTNFVDAVKSLKLAPAYDAEWQARVQSILEQKNSGIDDTTVLRIENRPPLIYFDFYGICMSGGMAEHYGVKSILVVLKEMIDDKAAIEEVRNGNLQPLTKVAEKDMEILEMIALNSDPMQHVNASTAAGLEVSYEAAEYWNRLGAAHGNPQSMRSLARLIYTQDKSLRGISRALYWLARSQIATLRF